MGSLLPNGGRKLKPHLPVVWFLTDTARTPDAAAALKTLPRGAGVIFRHYESPDRRALARDLALLCRARGLLFLVAGDWRLAVAVGADGIHLPEPAAKRGLSSGARIWRRHRGGVLTVAAHGARGLSHAYALGADAALLSPVFPTRSHPGQTALGPTRAAGLARSARVDVLALGGVTPMHVTQMRAAGFAGIAGIDFAMKNVA